MAMNTASLREWEAASASVLQQVDQLLLSLGASAAIRSYLQQMKGYPRVLYMCAAWVSEPQLRFGLGTAFCQHSCGLKLIDDLIDGDQDLSPRDLVSGHVFCEDAGARYSALVPGHRISEDWRGTWMPIYGYVFQEPDQVITSYPVWLAGAVQKSGKLMAAYCRAAMTAETDRPLVDLAADAMEAIGVLYMISDDVRDHAQQGERVSNLLELVHSGHVDAGEVLATLTDLRQRISRACTAREPSFDFFPYIDLIFDKCFGLFGRLQHPAAEAVA